MTTAASGPAGTARAGRRRRERVSGDEREAAILATAERLLATARLEEVSVEAIASGAGISRSTFYFYFATKEAVLLALLDRLRVEADAAGEQAFSRGAGRAARYREVIGAFAETFTEHRAVAVAAARARGADPAVDALWAQVLGGWVDRAERTIRHEQEAGTAPADVDPRALASALTLLNERAISASLLGEPSAPPADALVDVLTAVWVRAVYARAQP